MKKSRIVIRDALGAALLFAASCAGGMAVNHFRSEPLAILYEAPGESLQLIQGVGEWELGTHRIGIEVAKSLVEKKGALVVDARPDLFYEFGHIPGAVNLSYKNFDSDYPAVVGHFEKVREVGVPIMIYCAHEHCPDASKVASRLQENDAFVILVYEGGYDEWERMGFDVSQGSSQ